MRIIIKLFLLSGLLSFAIPALAQISVNINVGPPPPRREVIVETPNPGWVWVPGYYVAAGSGWEWRAGRWEAPPAPGQVWVRPRYVRNGDHYVYYEGKWKGKGMKHDNGKHKGWGKGREK